MHIGLIMVQCEVRSMLNKTLQRTLGFQDRLELPPEEIVITEWDAAMAGSQRNNLVLSKRGGPDGGSSLGLKMRSLPCPVWVCVIAAGRGEVDVRERPHSSFAGCFGRSDSGVRSRLAEILDDNNGCGDGLELGDDDGDSPDDRGCQ